jgi:hypothetical protein
MEIGKAFIRHVSLHLDCPRAITNRLVTPLYPTQLPLKSVDSATMTIKNEHQGWTNFGPLDIVDLTNGVGVIHVPVSSSSNIPRLC